MSREDVKTLDSKVRAFNPAMDSTSQLYKELKGSKKGGKKRKEREG